MKTSFSEPWIAVILAMLLAGCGHEELASRQLPVTGAGGGEALGRALPAVFEDQAEALGLSFRHFNGRSGELYFCETVGSGAALFDYDGDGDLDVYLVQGSLLGAGKRFEDALDPPPDSLPPRDRLFRNDLTVTAEGARRFSFTDVTEQMGVTCLGYGMGVTAGDYDGDGRIDLYVTNFGDNQLLRNLGGGVFADVTAEAGVGDSRWSTSAALVDYDRDGHLDLYVCNYVDFSFANHKPCFGSSSAREYCGPMSFGSVPDRLFRGLGDGTFEDASDRSQISREYGGALGVACADFNGDDWLDFYVANDGTANQLWINQGDGTFANGALLGGCAYNSQGTAEASMGIDAGDVDGDGDEDIFLAHLDDETNTLYINDGSGIFEDRSLASGLAIASRSFTAFGTAWIDFDNDGWLDLLTANGAVKTISEQVRRGESYPLKQTNQLFRNLGGVKFEEVTARGGAALAIPEVSRGATFGDLDNDGDTDVVVVNNGGPVRLLVNQIGNRSPWLGLALTDSEVGRSVEGMRVEVVLEGGRSLWRRVRTVASYLSANDPRVLVGLGAGGRVDVVRTHWPDGTIEEWRGLAAGRYHDLVKGESEH